jgi:ketosteroid isomerase-like protein
MSQENVERLRDVYSAWAKGDFRAGGELLAPDVVFEPMSDGRQAYRGRGAVENQMREFLAQWSEFRVEAHDFEEVGDAVLVTERQYGKGKGSGIETEGTFYAVWIFHDGRVIRVKWETDRAKALGSLQSPRVRGPQEAG